jgi:hypothetical protein
MNPDISVNVTTRLQKSTINLTSLESNKLVADLGEWDSREFDVIEEKIIWMWFALISHSKTVTNILTFIIFSAGVMNNMRLFSGM